MNSFLICRDQAERLVDLMTASPIGHETPLYEFHQELREKFGMVSVDDVLFDAEKPVAELVPREDLCEHCECRLFHAQRCHCTNDE